MARILVIDDDDRNLRLAVTVLEQAHHEVMSAASGPEGLSLAANRAPDLVLVDIQMPGMDGYATLRHLRALPCTARVPIAALTALAMRGDRERLLAEGFDGYLEKPIRYAAFLESVARLLQGSAHA